MIVIFAFSLVILSCTVFRFVVYKSVNPILRGAVGLYALIWFIIPGLIIVFFPYDELRSSLYGILEERQFHESFIKASFELSAIISAVYLLIRFTKSGQKWVSQTTSSNVGNLVFLLFFVVMIWNTFYGIGSYVDNNSASLYDQNRQGFLFHLIEAVALSALILVSAEARNRSRTLWIGLGFLAWWLFISLMNGGRIAFLAIIALVIFRHFRYGKLLSGKTLLKIVFGVLILVFFILPLSYQIQDLRRNPSMRLQDLSFNYEGLFLDLKGFSGMLFKKFDSFSAGFVLVNSVKSDDQAHAGFAPYIGSFLIFIPRALWLKRPVAGSGDGTIYGHPSRLVPRLLDVNSDSLNVGVSKLHITLWQFGTLGYLAFLLTCVIYLYFINHLLSSRNVFSRIMGVYLIGFPALVRLFPSPDEAVKELVICLILLFFVWFCTQLFLCFRKAIKRAKFSSKISEGNLSCT